MARLRGDSAAGPEEAFLVESENSIVFPDRRFVAVVGVPNVAVVDAGDAVLIVSRDRTEEVKQVVEYLRKRKRTDLL